MMPQIRFAIIDDNMLTCLGLQQLLAEMIPMAEIVVCESVDELERQENKQFLHYFVSSRLYFEHAQFFRESKIRSIVLVNGDMQISGVYTLNVCQDEQSLVRSILALHSKGQGPAFKHPTPTTQHLVNSELGEDATHQHPLPSEFGQEATHHHPLPSEFGQEATHNHPTPNTQHPTTDLSPREIEVAIQLCKGFINKEIADHLNVSLTTIITHRKNIMEKLHARSLADIIIYCVVNGLVDVGEI